jgi:transcriptional regulator with XRE-family HTH domain
VNPMNKKNSSATMFDGRPILRRGPFPVTMTLADLRQAHRMSQGDIAKALGVDQAVISRRERAGAHVVVSTLQDYARALGCECEVTFVSKLGHRYTVDLEEPIAAADDDSSSEDDVRAKRLKR